MMPEKGEFITNIMPERKVHEYVPPPSRPRFEKIDGGRKDKETPKQARERYQKKRKIAAWSSLTALGVGGVTMGGLEIADQAGSQHPAVIGWQGFKEGVKQIGGKILYSLGFNKEGKEVFADLGEETPLSTQTSTEAKLTTEESTLTVEQEAAPENVNPVAAGEIGPVEDEGVTIPAIEGLKYDAKTDTFFAVEGNPYGLEAETKVGVFVKDAFEFNGQMENSIGLRPEVIEVLQKDHLNKNRELKFPIPFNLERDKGITMEVVENEIANKSLDIKRAEEFTLVAINTPKDTVFYSPIKTKIEDRYTGINISEDKEYSLSLFQLTIPEDFREKIFYKQSERIDWAYMSLSVRNADILITPIKNTSGGFQSETDFGLPLFKIIDDLNPNSQKDSELDQIFHGKYLLNFSYTVEQVFYNEENKKYEVKFILETGENIFLNLNNIKVSFLTANDK